MGRPRVDLETHALTGTKAHYVEPESLVVGSRPRIPKEFRSRPELRRAFKEYSRSLEHRRTLTEGDGDLIRLIVLCRDRHLRAMEHIQTEGEICVYQRLDSNGQAVDVVKPNLWLKVAQDSEKQIVACLDRLGMTPTNRAKVKPTEKPEAEEDKAGAALLSREEAARQKAAAEVEPDLDALLKGAENLQ